MATPRKHWFRVSDSILNEGWDPHTTHTVVRLLAFLNTRWQREGLSAEDACEAIIDGTTAAWITGDGRTHVALKRLYDLPRVAGIASLSVDVVLDHAVGPGGSFGTLGPGAGSEDGWTWSRRALDAVKKPTRLLLRWPKFAEFQSFGSPKMPSPTPTPSPTPKIEEKKEQKEPASPVVFDDDPRAWARMFTSEQNQPPEGAVAWVASVLPVIEGEADAAFPREPPSRRARNGKVRALLWRYWRHQQSQGWQRQPARVNGRRPTVIEETKRELERRREGRARAESARGSIPALVARVAADGRGND